jgi:acetolactate synthase I/II/III large subunit
MKMTGAQAVVECIRREGVRHAFCVPGESYLGVIDALYGCEEVDLISNRHEGGASFAAEAYAKATGKPGVCFVTRGPGATNAAIGVHTARQDSTPLVLFVGQVERDEHYREAFQEVDFEAFFGPLAKWAIEVRSARRMPELVQRAFHVAKSGRPGPVVVSLPEDVLQETAEMGFGDPYPVAAPAPAPEDVSRVLGALRAAERPVIIAGGGVIRSGGRSALVELSERLEVPVYTAFRRQDAFPNGHPNYLGHLGLGAPGEYRSNVREADVVLALGTRFSDPTTGSYTLLREEQTLIHVDIDPQVFGAYRPPEVAVVSDARRALEALLREAPDLSGGRRAWIREHRRFYETHTDPANSYTGSSEYVDQAKMVEQMTRLLPADAVITVDAGNFSLWVHRFYQFREPGTLVGPTSGAMGYGLPAALGARLAHPGRTVVSVSGDGGFMMTLGELATATRHGINTVSIVVNNGMHGTIRTHQERQFPGRVYATGLENPDFAQVARQFGAHAERVERTEEFAPALERALAAEAPAVIEVLADPERITPDATIQELRGR